jgi:hypothetical protein
MGFEFPKIELPRTDEGGGPAGVNDPEDEGGGPAGVVDGFEAAKENKLLSLFDLLSGVDGSGLEEKGTWKPDIVEVEPDRRPGI